MIGLILHCITIGLIYRLIYFYYLSSFDLIIFNSLPPYLTFLPYFRSQSSSSGGAGSHLQLAASGSGSESDGESIVQVNEFSVQTSSRRGGDGFKRMDVRIVILASYKFHFIRLHDTSNNKSIFMIKVHK